MMPLEIFQNFLCILAERILFDFSVSAYWILSMRFSRFALNTRKTHYRNYENCAFNERQLKNQESWAWVQNVITKDLFWPEIVWSLHVCVSSIPRNFALERIDQWSFEIPPIECEYLGVHFGRKNACDLEDSFGYFRTKNPRNWWLFVSNIKWRMKF